MWVSLSVVVGYGLTSLGCEWWLLGFLGVSLLVVVVVVDVGGWVVNWIFWAVSSGY